MIGGEPKQMPGAFKQAGGIWKGKRRVVETDTESEETDGES